MKPVNQTRFGKEGNCFCACIASILECPIEIVDFKMGENWIVDTQAILGRHGFMFIGVNILKGHCIVPLPDPYCIFTGRSPRDASMLHSVVGKLVHFQEKEIEMVAYRTVHDPHPDKTGIVGEPEEIGFIVPISPVVSFHALAI